MNNGWVRIHRKITKSAFYNDPNTIRVYFHIMFSANYKAVQYEGQDLEEGQLVISPGVLGKQLQMSRQQTRRAIDNLKKNGIITTKGTNRFTVITIMNWENEQKSKLMKQPAKQPTTQPTKPLENNQQENDISTAELINKIKEANQQKNGKTTSKTTNETTTIKEEQKKIKEYTLLINSENEFKTYGDYVKLTDDQMDRLKKDFPKELVDEIIQELDAYIENKGEDPYRSHYKTIRVWIAKEKRGVRGIIVKKEKKPRKTTQPRPKAWGTITEWEQKGKEE